MKDSKDAKKKDKRVAARRDSEGGGERRSLSGALFPGEEITQKDIGLEQDRRKDARRSGKDRRK